MSSQPFSFVGNINVLEYVSFYSILYCTFLTEVVDFRQHRVLRISFWIKLAFIIVEICLAVAFASCSFKESYNAAAVLEWAVSFIFTFYVFSFFIDLIPAVHTKHSQQKFGGSAGETEMQMEQNDHYSRSREHVNGGYDAGYGAGRNTAESQRTLGANDVRTVNGVKYQNGAPIPNNF